MRINNKYYNYSSKKYLSVQSVVDEWKHILIIFKTTFLLSIFINTVILALLLSI